jgi:hypothetical protein
MSLAEGYELISIELIRQNHFNDSVQQVADTMQHALLNPHDP